MNAVVQSSADSAHEQLEWQIRVYLAAAYCLISCTGWDDLVFNHVSARLPAYGT